MREGVEYRYDDESLRFLSGTPAEDEMSSWVSESEAEAYRIASQAFDDVERQEVVYTEKLDPALEKFKSKADAARERSAAEDAELSGVPDKMRFSGSVLLNFASLDRDGEMPEWLDRLEAEVYDRVEGMYPDNQEFNNNYPNFLQAEIKKHLG